MSAPVATLPQFMSAATQEHLRLRDESAMRSTCTLTRALASGVNADNSPRDGGTRVITDVPCRYTVSLLRANEAMLAFGVSGDVHGALRVPLGTDVLVSDTVAIGGDQYEIVGINTGRTFTTSIQLALRLIQ